MYKLMLNNQIVAVPHWLVICVSTNVENMVVTLLCLHTKPGQVSSQSVNHRGNNKSMCLLALKILMVLKVVCECHLYLLTHSVNSIVESARGCCNYKMHFIADRWHYFIVSMFTVYVPAEHVQHPYSPIVWLNGWHIAYTLVYDSAHYRCLSNKENALHASSYAQHLLTAIPFALWSKCLYKCNI